MLPRNHGDRIFMDEVSDKFRSCARYARPPLEAGRVEEAIAAVRCLDALDDVREVMRLLSARQ